jgi:hypothetical protein
VIHFPLQQRLRNRVRNSFVRDVVVAYRHRGLLPDDVMLASYPKSGSTWLAYMLAQLLWSAGREQKLMDDRYLPRIGHQQFAEQRLPCGGRLIRTHERYRPAYRKAIYVVRDGRDVVVSMYWHVKRTAGMVADFSDYLATYLRGTLTGAGAWQEHVDGWLDSPANAAGNVLMVRYEDMKANAAEELRRAADFLGVRVTAEKIVDAVDAGSLDSMKSREKESSGIVHREAGETIPVVRKGVVGDWQNYFSPNDLIMFNRVARSAMSRLGYDVAASDERSVAIPT